MDSRSALIIAAHPDDEVIGCGGLISRYKGIIDFSVLYIAEGTTCRFEDRTTREAVDAIQERTRMAIESLRYLGINNYSFCNYPCGRLDQVPLVEINKSIETHINKWMPDTVFTHSSIDANQDHCKVHKATLIATRPYNSPVKSVLSYEVLTSSEWSFLDSFSPNVFIELSQKDVLAKSHALSLYTSEVKPYPYPRSETGIMTIAQARGMQAGYSFAEAYQLIRENIPL